MKRDCREQDIALYVEGDLAPANRREIEVHLRSCSECRELAASLEESQAMLKTLRNDTVSPVALSSVRTNVLEEINASAGWRPWRRWVYAVAGAAFVVVMVFVVLDRAPYPSLVQEIVPKAPGVPAVQGPPEFKPLKQIGAPQPLHAGVAPKKKRAVIDRAYSEENTGIASPPEASLVVKLLTDDPNVVIYWLVDKKDGGTL
jgi:hypothetical protein